jgi:hypothetical protein
MLVGGNIVRSGKAGDAGKGRLLYLIEGVVLLARRGLEVV